MPRSRSSKPAPVPWPTLSRFIDGGGHISIGRVPPIQCAAIANDEHIMYVALKRRRGESLTNLLSRLDESLKHCFDNEEFVDEINRP
jgi:hypothetical protein